MSILNDNAPPAEAPKSGSDFVRLQPFPKNDTLVLTITALNFIEKCEFNRKDDDGNERVEIRPGIELYYGAIIGGKPYFLKPWPYPYSIHEKANYARVYEAATGKAPVSGSKASELIGKLILGTVKNESKQGRKGTPYTVSKLASFMAVPEALIPTGAPVSQLRPALDAVLSAQGEKKEEAPF